MNVLVYIVDDDDAVRHSLELLIQSVGLETKSFASAQAFLTGYDPEKPGCLVLDVRMPEMNGLELQRVLHEKQIYVPVIIVTGHGDVPLAVRAMKEGAIEVLEKPFNDQALLDAISQAVEASVKAFIEQQERTDFLRRSELLSPREREIMNMLVLGRGSKEIANQLGISSKTVDVHRIHIMEKMRVKSVVELARLAVSIQ